MEVAVLYNVGSTLTCQNPLASNDLTGLTLSPGVYCSLYGGLSISDLGSLVLDAGNNPNAKWVFQTPGDFNCGRGSAIQLVNGALSSNVDWIVGSAANLGYGSTISGNVIAASKISLGAYAILDGRGFSLQSIVVDGNAIVGLPVDTVLNKFPSLHKSSNRGSICVISSINPKFGQAMWSGTDAGKAMIEAVAITMGVPTESVAVGFASQLCLTSPTGAPTVFPTFKPSRRPTARPISDLYLKESKATHYRSAPLQAIGGIHTLVDEPDPTKELSFSIYMSVPGNATAETVALITDSIKLLVKKAMTSGTLCEKFISRGQTLNVTFMNTPEGAKSAGTVCDEQPTFITVYTPAATMQPSSRPSSQPILHDQGRGEYSSGFIAFLLIVLLIWFLRFLPSFLDVIMKKNYEPVHTYDILVLNGFEEAVIQHVSHEDIAFFRYIRAEGYEHSSRWCMNDTSEILEKRFEVQFYDQYDLLGNNSRAKDDNDGCDLRSANHEVTGDKLVTKETYVQEAHLQVGMIIRVRPAPGSEVDSNKLYKKDVSTTAQREEAVPRRKGSTIYPSDYRDPSVKELDSVFNTPMGHTADSHVNEIESEDLFIQSRNVQSNTSNLWGYNFDSKSCVNDDSNVGSARMGRSSVIQPEVVSPLQIPEQPDAMRKPDYFNGPSAIQKSAISGPVGRDHNC